LTKAWRFWTPCTTSAAPPARTRPPWAWSRTWPNAAEEAGGGTPASNDGRGILTVIDSQLDHGAMSSNTMSFALPEALGDLR
jgi:hypothetical protein